MASYGNPTVSAGLEYGVMHHLSLATHRSSIWLGVSQKLGKFSSQDVPRELPHNTQIPAVLRLHARREPNLERAETGLPCAIADVVTHKAGNRVSTHRQRRPNAAKYIICTKLTPRLRATCETHSWAWKRRHSAKQARRATKTHKRKQKGEAKSGKQNAQPITRTCYPKRRTLQRNILLIE